MNPTTPAPWLHPKPHHAEPHVGSVITVRISRYVSQSCRIMSVRHHPGQPRPLWRLRAIDRLGQDGGREYWSCDLKRAIPVLIGDPGTPRKATRP